MAVTSTGYNCLRLNYIDNAGTKSRSQSPNSPAGHSFIRGPRKQIQILRRIGSIELFLSLELNQGLCTPPGKVMNQKRKIISRKSSKGLIPHVMTFTWMGNAVNLIHVD